MNPLFSTIRLKAEAKLVDNRFIILYYYISYIKNIIQEYRIGDDDEI
jgi:hypothetical protein